MASKRNLLWKRGWFSGFMLNSRDVEMVVCLKYIFFWGVSLLEWSTSTKISGFAPIFLRHPKIKTLFLSFSSSFPSSIFFWSWQQVDQLEAVPFRCRADFPVVGRSGGWSKHVKTLKTAPDHYVPTCINCYIYMYMYVYVCIRMYMYVYICICMYMYVYVCIPMYMYVYICICMYTYVYTNSNIHIYTSIHIYIYAVHMIFRVANGTTSAVPRFDVQVLKKNTNIVLTFILDHSWFFGIALTMNFVFVPFLFLAFSN